MAPPLRELLAGVTSQQAIARPVASAHSIWELVLHIDLYVRLAIEATQGKAMTKLFGTEQDWPEAAGGDEPWTTAKDHLYETGESLAQAIERSTDAQLQDAVPDEQYDFYYLFHGIVQHSLYHAGQIALLKKALPAT